MASCSKYFLAASISITLVYIGNNPLGFKLDSGFRQNNFDQLCNAERGWAFERVLGASLEGFDHKVTTS